MARRRDLRQLSLLDFIDAASGAETTTSSSRGDAPWPRGSVVDSAAVVVSAPRTVEDRIAGHIEQIRRDLAVLAGPPEYCCDREFYEWRVAAHREDVLRLQSELSA